MATASNSKPTSEDSSGFPTLAAASTMPTTKMVRWADCESDDHWSDSSDYDSDAEEIPSPLRSSSSTHTHTHGECGGDCGGHAAHNDTEDDPSEVTRLEAATFISKNLPRIKRKKGRRGIGWTDGHNLWYCPIECAGDLGHTLFRCNRNGCSVVISKKWARTHNKRAHPQKGTIDCGICGDRICHEGNPGRAIGIHVHQEHSVDGEGKHQCRYCKYRITASQMGDHLNAMHNNLLPRITCNKPGCGMVIRKRDLLDHLHTEHPYDKGNSKQSKPTGKSQTNKGSKRQGNAPAPQNTQPRRQNKPETRTCDACGTVVRGSMRQHLLDNDCRGTRKDKRKGTRQNDQSNSSKAKAATGRNGFAGLRKATA